MKKLRGRHALLLQNLADRIGAVGRQLPGAIARPAGLPARRGVAGDRDAVRQSPSAAGETAAPAGACARRAPSSLPETSSCRSDRSISMLRPCLVSSIMTCLESSAISGMSCIAWRSEAEASANAPSLSSRAPKLLLRPFSSGARRGRSVLRLDLAGVLQPRPGRQTVDLDDAGIADRGLHAERLAHRAGDDLQLLLVLVLENATSMTKNATSRPIRSAKVTNQP